MRPITITAALLALVGAANAKNCILKPPEPSFSTAKLVEVSESTQAFLASLGVIHKNLAATAESDGSSIKCEAGKLRGSQMCVVRNVVRTSHGLQFFGKLPSDATGFAVDLTAAAEPFDASSCNKVIDEPVHLVEPSATDPLTLYLAELLPLYRTILQLTPVSRSAHIVSVSSAESSLLASVANVFSLHGLQHWSSFAEGTCFHQLTLAKGGWGSELSWKTPVRGFNASSDGRVATLRSFSDVMVKSFAIRRRGEDSGVKVCLLSSESSPVIQNQEELLHVVRQVDVFMKRTAAAAKQDEEAGQEVGGQQPALARLDVDKLEARALAKEVHSCSVLVGSTAPQLINLLFLAKGSAVIQILPYKAHFDGDEGLAALRAIAQAAGHHFFEWAPADASLSQVRWDLLSSDHSIAADMHLAGLTEDSISAEGLSAVSDSDVARRLFASFWSKQDVMVPATAFKALVHSAISALSSVERVQTSLYEAKVVPVAHSATVCSSKARACVGAGVPHLHTHQDASSYLRFNVSGISPARMQYAVLRLRCHSGFLAATTAHGITPSSASAAAVALPVNWDGRPDPGQALAEFRAFDDEQVHLDLTEFVISAMYEGHAEMTIALHGASSRRAVYFSHLATNPVDRPSIELHLTPA
jgi:hypothetical protein